jgi:transcriptional regulator with AAA-type ATPase domain
MKSLAALKDKIGTLPFEEQTKLLDLLTELEEAENKTAAKDDFHVVCSYDVA